jgi:hypothetical protein
MREHVDRLIVAGLVLAVAGAGFLLWLGLGKPGITKPKPRPVVTVLSAARIGALNGILGPDALLFEPGPRDAGADPLGETVALTEIQCDASHRPDPCRAGVASTLIPGRQVDIVDGLVMVARGRCRRELRQLVSVVGAAQAAVSSYAAHGPTPAVQAAWTGVDAALVDYVTLDAGGSPELAGGLAACTPR